MIEHFSFRRKVYLFNLVFAKINRCAFEFYGMTAVMFMRDGTRRAVYMLRRIERLGADLDDVSLPLTIQITR